MTVEPRSQTSGPKQEATRGKAAQAHVKALGQVCRGSGWGDGWASVGAALWKQSLGKRVMV